MRIFIRLLILLTKYSLIFVMVDSTFGNTGVSDIDYLTKQYQKFLYNYNPDSILHYSELRIRHYFDEKDTLEVLKCYESTCQQLIFGRNIEKLAGPVEAFIELAEIKNNTYFIARANYLAGDFFYLGKINQAVALRYYYKSLRMFEEIQDNNNIALTNYMLGNCLASSDGDKALSHLLKGIEFVEEYNLDAWWHPYKNIAEYFRHNCSDYENARKYYRKALLRAERSGNVREIACNLVEHGCVDLQYHRDDSILFFFEKALEIALPVKDSVSIMFCYRHMADYYDKKQEYEKALYYQSKVSIDQISIEDSYLENSLKKLAELERKTGNYRKAARSYERYISLSDSLRNQQRAKEFASLELRFELEKKEKDTQQKLLVKEQIANATIKKQKAIRNLFIALTILSVVIIYLIFRVYRSKRKTDKRLRETEIMKLRFFTNISHEIRTPLTLLISPMERLFNMFKNTGEGPLLSAMLHNTIRLKNLIDQLLDISKIEGKGLHPDVSIHDFNQLFRISTSMFESLAKDKNIVYEVIEEPHHLVFAFDKQRMEQVLNNLLSNAFKYTPEGGKIIVRLSKDDDALALVVKDTGIGIATENIPDIFSRFYQVSDAYGGSGLGLTIVKEYVDLHKGTIEVQSEPDKGSEFIVRIPMFTSGVIADEKREEQSNRITAPSDEHTLSMDSSQKGAKEQKILIVEDNKDLRNYLATIFNESFQVLKASNGHEGEQMATFQSPDLIISDVMMPLVNGYDLTDSLKSKLETSHIPIILLTAKTNRDDKLTGLKKGADDYILKPFDEKELILKTANILRTRKNLRDKYKTNITVNPSEITTNSIDEQFLIDITLFVEKNISNTCYTVDLLSKDIALSKRNLQRKLKYLTNMSPNEFIRSIRLKRAAQLLSQKAGSVSDIAYQTGFENLSYFTKRFKEAFHQLPSEYSK